jgi:3-hydroxybutyryl-CoA dehydrogenase
MGSGIAQTVAEAGYTVYLNDMTEDFIRSGQVKINAALAKLTAKGKMEEKTKSDISARIIPLLKVKGDEGIDMVIEAIIENMESKWRLFEKLGKILSPETVFASNTSSLSVTGIGSKSPRPDKYIGLHFFNPAPVMKLVELIKGAQSSDETVSQVRLFAESIGKTVVEVNEAPGFVVNRLLISLINEAAYTLSDGVATAEDIDHAMKLGANHPIGPLALGDLIGLDVCLAVMETLQREFGDDKYRPCPLLRRMVLAGWLGRKTGRGFFDYSAKQVNRAAAENVQTCET